MLHELPVRTRSFTPYKFKRYFDAKNDRVRIWGKCEVTEQNYECFVPTNEFYAYLQGEKTIGISMPSVPKEDREFLLTGTSPNGWKVLFPTEPEK